MYKPKEFAKLLKVSVRTLQRWDKTGQLKAYRTETNRRYYTQEQYREYLGEYKETVEWGIADNETVKRAIENKTASEVFIQACRISDRMDSYREIDQLARDLRVDVKYLVDEIVALFDEGVLIMTPKGIERN